jgi:hypothetical protein
MTLRSIVCAQFSYSICKVPPFLPLAPITEGPVQSGSKGCEDIGWEKGADEFMVPFMSTFHLEKMHELMKIDIWTDKGLQGGPADYRCKGSFWALWWWGDLNSGVHLSGAQWCEGTSTINLEWALSVPCHGYHTVLRPCFTWSSITIMHKQHTIFQS